MGIDPDLIALLTGFPVVIDWPVQWGDMDAYLHVNNTVFFRWFESARIAYTTRLGLKEMKNRDQIGPILASVACDYRRQITYPDTVVIGSRISKIGRTSFAMDHALVSVAQRVVAAECRSTIVVLNYSTNTPIPVPDNIRQAIAEIEGRPL